MFDASSLGFRPAFAMLAPIGQRPAGIVAKECFGRHLAIVEARKGGDAQFAEQFLAQFGVSPSTGPRCISSSRIALLGLRPSRWLAIATSAEAQIIEPLERAVAGCASLIDQTDGLALLRINGSRVRNVFAKGLPIDLADGSFAIGDVAVSAIAHIGVTVWRLDDAFEIAVQRSYAGAFAQWLREAAAEFGLEVA